MGSCMGMSGVVQCVPAVNAPPWSQGGALICWLEGVVVYDQVVVGLLVVRGVLHSLCV